MADYTEADVVRLAEMLRAVGSCSIDDAARRLLKRGVTPPPPPEPAVVVSCPYCADSCRECMAAAAKCGPDCDLHIVRLGKVQCNRTSDQCPNARACLACGRSHAPWVVRCPHCGADPVEEQAALDAFDPMEGDR